ncbi:MAG: hypothetical protein AAGA90_08845 [Actinomycetota bacterium]
MRVGAALLGAFAGFALGALVWRVIAPDAATGSLVLLGAVDAAVGAFVGWTVASRRTD